jgi:spermidine synthase
MDLFEAPRPYLSSHSCRSVLFVFIFLACAADLRGECGDEYVTGKIVFTGKSEFSTLFVVDEAHARYLRFGSPCGRDQSTMNLVDPSIVSVEYLRIATLGLAFVDRRERVLMMGLGGGTWTNLIARILPDVHIDAVEIDPLVVDVARRFFGVRPSPRYRLHVIDAYDYANLEKQPYDLIFLDLYTDSGMPEHLQTDEFFEAIRRQLADDSVVVANLGLGAADEYLQLAQVMRRIFGEAVCVSARTEANLVVFAGSSENATIATAAARAIELDSILALPFGLSPVAKRMRLCP